MVAGLEEPTVGTHPPRRPRRHRTRKPYQRPVNTVFQSYALFPHLDVGENVAFGLRRRGVGTSRQQVSEALDLVELGAPRAPQAGPALRRPAAARRARPGDRQPAAVLLLDEPLGALDLKLRRQMQLELKRIQTEVGITFVHVTHDQEEAMTMADTVAVMNARPDRAARLAGRPVRGAADHVRRQLPRPVQPGPRPRVPRAADEVDVVDGCYGSRVARAAAERCVDERRPAGRRPAGEDPAAAGDRSAHARRGDRTCWPAASSPTRASPGVSTQYLVRMPWGQELTVFVQNLGGVRRAVRGRCHRAAAPGTPAHTFGLVGDAAAGVEPTIVPAGASVGERGRMAIASVAHAESAAGAGPEPPATVAAARRARLPYLLLLPGMLWLARLLRGADLSAARHVAAGAGAGRRHRGVPAGAAVRQLRRRDAAVLRAVRPLVRVRRAGDAVRPC